jgi:hypothetical protein
VAQDEGASAAATRFIAAIAKHRNWGRESDPPKV